MRFPPQFLDELRARLPVSDVVGRRVKLKKAGREWKGLSPFNKERSPSFFVNDQKGFYHDFSSGKHGDIFGFVMDTEGVTFPEAVERLAAMAGLAVPKMSAEADAQEHRRRTLHDVMELAAKFFEATLASRAGAKARGYLADRSLDPATQLKFRIGYAPAERFALKEHLGSHGISSDDMVEAGLLVSADDIPVPYDRFRDRVMFPISDLSGRIVAFGGRALDKDAPAKYLNSPETPLFHKGAMLYNGAPARQAAHRGAPVIVVEGYVDVIAMVTAGSPTGGRARVRSPRCCGCARPPPGASTRPNGAPDSRRASRKSRPRSPTRRCGNIIARTSRPSCAICSRRRAASPASRAGSRSAARAGPKAGSRASFKASSADAAAVSGRTTSR